MFLMPVGIGAILIIIAAVMWDKAKEQERMEAEAKRVHQRAPRNYRQLKGVLY